MEIKFGTSGLRGLVSEMTPEVITRYTQAFLSACDTGAALYVGRDLRPSSERIAQNVIAAARQAGLDVVDCGELPTPALALAATEAGGSAVMVTGSHIPADRNGLKFYTPQGEITKTEEASISTALCDEAVLTAPEAGTLEMSSAAQEAYVTRYLDAYGPGALAGQRIGLYAHSAVGRDLLAEILSALGAEVIPLGRSDVFIPVDTEAVGPELRQQIRLWVKTHGLDALVSTDGDSDRPLLANEAGEIVPGDIMGQITAEALGADVVVTPISSNSGVTHKAFAAVQLTRIGSPFVIAGMAQAAGRVVGYEANGGFLLGFEARGPAGHIAPLMTRDCTLPLLAVLHAALGSSVAARVRREPPQVTLSDRLQEVPQTQSGPFIARLSEAAARAAFLSPLGLTEQAVDRTDGVRILLQDGEILHIRASGNAPELRLYIEAKDKDRATALMTAALGHLKAAVQR